MEERQIKIWDIAKAGFGLDPDSNKKLGSFESEIWEVYRNGTPFILRITDPNHRDQANLISEAIWIEHLGKHGIPVALPIQTLKGEYIAVSQDPHYYLMLFQKASGHVPTHQDATKEFVQSWGCIMGKMHRLASEFSPPDNFQRTNLIKSFSSLWKSVETQVDPTVHEYYQNILKTCIQYPTNQYYYGILHYDLHMGNFFVDDGQITIFDFDDMQYGWYVYDIAMPLYYWFWGADRKGSSLSTNQFKRAEDSIWFLQNFLTGYTREFSLPPEWLEMLPIFLVIRQMELYFVFEHRFQNVSDESSPLGKLKAFFKDQVVNRKPHIPLEVFQNTEKWFF